MVRAHLLVRILSWVCSLLFAPHSSPVSKQVRNKFLGNEFGLDLAILCSILVHEVHHNRSAKYNLILGVLSGLNIH